MTLSWSLAMLSAVVAFMGLYAVWVARGRALGTESAGAGGYATGFMSGVLWVGVLAWIESMIQ